MSLGLESGTVRVVPYDAAWPELFVIEANRLYERFARQKLAIVIEHTGSTAVPGLAAKPILDILAGRPESELVQPYIRTLIGADYVHRGAQEIPGRVFSGAVNHGRTMSISRRSGATSVKIILRFGIGFVPTVLCAIDMRISSVSWQRGSLETARRTFPERHHS